MSQSGCGVKSRYSVDLVDLHSLCESNYMRLRRVFPDYENTNERKLRIGDASSLTLSVSERSRYTTTFQLTHLSPVSKPFGGVRLHVRLYHDARMAEVLGFQKHRQLEGRYPYPNQHMYQRDEKQQQNRYLGELLSFCLAEGRDPAASLYYGDH